MRDIALDTETYYDIDRGINIPFVLTMSDGKKNEIYDLRVHSQYKKAKKICENDDTKCFHNGPYDITCLSNIGIKVKGKVEDTMPMANILNENFESKKLKSLAKRYLNEPCLEEKALSKAKKKIKKELVKAGKWDANQDLPYNLIPMDILGPYAKKDSVYTYRLAKLFSKIIQKYQDAYDLELACIPIIVEMQKLGMKIDRKFCKQMYDAYKKEMVHCEKKIQAILTKNKITFRVEKQYKRYPKKVDVWDKIIKNENGALAVRYDNYNPDSDKHTIHVLKSLGIETGKITSEKTGQMAIDKESLKPFMDKPFVQLYLRWQFLSKQTGTYYGPLYAWYTSKQNDRGHFALYQTGAKSGRFSAELIQTIPRIDAEKEEKDMRIIRNAFIPEKGYYLAAIDYDQIEMRLFAHFSNCKVIIQDIKNGFDPHLGTARAIFPEIIKLEEALRKSKNEKEIKKIKAKIKAFRRKAKTINFGIIYGMGQAKLAASLDLPLLEAKETLDEYYKIYPVREYLRNTVSELYRTGSVKVILDSPLCRIFREYRVPQELAYKAVNIIIQGTAAYMMKLGMIRVYEYIKKHKLDVRLLMTIHDELVFEISRKYNPKYIIPKLVACMNDDKTFKVPIIASPKISYKSWGDCRDWKEAA